jgi:hypothetical protein
MMASYCFNILLVLAGTMAANVSLVALDVSS